MTKSDLIAALDGKQKNLGVLLGLTNGRISQLPEVLPEPVVDRVVGAAVRAGVMHKIVHLFKLEPPAHE